MQSISLFIMNDHLNDMKLVLYPSMENHYYHIIRESWVMISKDNLIYHLIVYILMITSAGCSAADDIIPYYRLASESGDYLGISMSSNDIQLYGEPSDQYFQKFLIVSLDDSGHYAIISRESGLCFSVIDRSGRLQIIQRKYTDDDDSQKWRLKPIGGINDSIYFIIPKLSGDEVMCISLTDGNEVGIDSLDYSQPDEQHQAWNITEVDGEQILLPPLKGTNESYTSYGNITRDLPELKGHRDYLPPSTEPRLVSEIYVPFIYVNDSYLSSPKSKINESPYYILKLEQFWKKTNVDMNPGTSDRKVTFWYKTGISESQLSEMTRTLGKSISKEVQKSQEFSVSYQEPTVKAEFEGFGVERSGGFSGGYKRANSRIYRQSQDLQETSKNVTSKDISEERTFTEERSYLKGDNVIEALYTLVDRYTLLRMDESIVDSWDIQTRDYYYITHTETLNMTR